MRRFVLVVLACSAGASPARADQTQRASLVASVQLAGPATRDGVTQRLEDTGFEAATTLGARAEGEVRVGRNVSIPFGLDYLSTSYTRERFSPRVRTSLDRFAAVAGVFAFGNVSGHRYGIDCVAGPAWAVWSLRGQSEHSAALRVEVGLRAAWAWRSGVAVLLRAAIVGDLASRLGDEPLSADRMWLSAGFGVGGAW